MCTMRRSRGCERNEVLYLGKGRDCSNMKKKSTRRLFGTLVALTIIVAGGALIYSGWQSKPGREEILALGIGMTIGGLVLVVWFGR
jgi:TRAP-type C4-dicarboxylate transport system permease small subunit